MILPSILLGLVSLEGMISYNLQKVIGMLAHRCATSWLEAEGVGSNGECGWNSRSIDLTSCVSAELEFFYFSQASVL